MKKIETIKLRTLVLEDDLMTLGKIMIELHGLKRNLVGGKIDFAVTVFSEYKQFQDYLNKTQESNFYFVIHDNECKLGVSFNNINMSKFGAAHIIEITSRAEHNNTAAEKRFHRAAREGYRGLYTFTKDLVNEIKTIIEKEYE